MEGPRGDGTATARLVDADPSPQSSPGFEWQGHVYRVGEFVLVRHEECDERGALRPLYVARIQALWAEAPSGGEGAAGLLVAH